MEAVSSVRSLTSDGDLLKMPVDNRRFNLEGFFLLPMLKLFLGVDTAFSISLSIPSYDWDLLGGGCPKLRSLRSGRGSAASVVTFESARLTRSITMSPRELSLRRGTMCDGTCSKASLWRDDPLSRLILPVSVDPPILQLFKLSISSDRCRFSIAMSPRQLRLLLLFMGDFLEIVERSMESSCAGGGGGGMV